MSETPLSPTNGYEWKWDTDRPDGGVQIDSVQAAVPELYPGASLDLTCLFYRSPADQGDGFTLGGDAGVTLGGDTGATLGGTAPFTHIDRYRAVREYTQFSGRYSSLETLSGELRLSDRTPGDAPIPSIIVRLEPGPANTATPAIWVAVDDVDDATIRPADVSELTITATLIDRADRIKTRDQLFAQYGTDLT